MKAARIRRHRPQIMAAHLPASYRGATSALDFIGRSGSAGTNICTGLLRTDHHAQQRFQLFPNDQRSSGAVRGSATGITQLVVVDQHAGGAECELAPCCHRDGAQHDGPAEPNRIALFAEPCCHRWGTCASPCVAFGMSVLLLGAWNPYSCPHPPTTTTTTTTTHTHTHHHHDPASPPPTNTGTRPHPTRSLRALQSKPSSGAPGNYSLLQSAQEVWQIAVTEGRAGWLAATSFFSGRRPHMAQGGRESGRTNVGCQLSRRARRQRKSVS